MPCADSVAKKMSPRPLARRGEAITAPGQVFFK
jgi:hypothetical protein